MNDADLDLIIFIENIFDAHIPEEEAKRGLRWMQESLERSLSGQRPTVYAAELLSTLAKARCRPDLIESLHKPWRPEQISALLLDIFRKRNSPIELHEMLLLPRLRRLGGQRASKLGWRDLLPSNVSVLIFVVLLTLILLFRSLPS